ncbi:hypothetical protein K7G98_33995, partial [Saccharothrix sp. MB29]|nr:hypothetical protein [Saccharothrix sp. MB29]
EVAGVGVQGAGRLVVEVLRSTTEQGCGLVLVTHDHDHAAKMGRVFHLSDGLLHQGSASARVVV